MKKYVFLLVAVLLSLSGVIAFVADVTPVTVIPFAVITSVFFLAVTVKGFNQSLIKSQIVSGTLMALLAGSAASYLFGWPPMIITGIIFLVSLRFARAPNIKTQLRSGVFVEIWLAELITSFRQARPYLERIQDYSDKVKVLNTEAAVIHFNEIGADPAVLINNTTYPINVVGRTDTDVPVSLDKFDTENTKITEDELQGLNYNKIQSVTTQHADTLADVQGQKAIHALAPASNASATPVIKTSGTARSDTPTRKRAKATDVVSLGKAMDLAGVPRGNRILVLHPYHAADLMEENITLAVQFANVKDGEMVRFQGFDMYVDLKTAIYNGSFAKKAFGAAAAPSTDHVSSTAFHVPRAFRARGNKQMFYSMASTNPQYRQTEVGFREFFICMMKTSAACASLVDDDAA